MNDYNNKTTAHFRYIIELDAPVWPRKLADDLMNAGTVTAHLVGVTDLQNDTHIYGATYFIQDRYERGAGAIHEAPNTRLACPT